MLRLSEELRRRRVAHDDTDLGVWRAITTVEQAVKALRRYEDG